MIFFTHLTIHVVFFSHEELTVNITLTAGPRMGSRAGGLGVQGGRLRVETGGRGVENRRELDLVSGKQITILEMKPYELNS